MINHKLTTHCHLMKFCFVKYIKDFVFGFEINCLAILL